MKFARLLVDWVDDEGNAMNLLEQEGLEVDHVEEGRSGEPPRNYCLVNLRIIDGPSHRQEQPGRGRKRPAAALQTLRRPARA